MPLFFCLHCGGVLSGSRPPFADALRNAGDVVALVIGTIAERLIPRAFTPETTFGYRWVGVVAALLNRVLFGVHRLDSLFSMGIGLYLIYASGSLVVESLAILMQFTPCHLCVIEIEKTILQEAAVRRIHPLHPWQLTDREIHLEANADFHEGISL